MMPGTQQPGAGLWSDWSLGESQWKAQMDSNLQYLSAAIQPALEVTSGALPANPATDNLLAWDATAGVLKCSASGAWVASPVQPRTGWSVWAKDLQAQINFTGSGWTEAPLEDAPNDDRTYARKGKQWVAQDYLINTYLAEIVGADSVQAAFIIPGVMTLIKAATGSVARCNTASAADLILSIRKNNIEVGTITFANASTDGVIALTADVPFVQNDELSIVTPSPLGATPEGTKILFRLEM